MNVPGLNNVGGNCGLKLFRLAFLHCLYDFCTCEAPNANVFFRVLPGHARRAHARELQII